MSKNNNTIKRFEIKSNPTDFPKYKILSSKESVKLIRKFYSDDIEIYESFFVLLLNRANTAIGYAKISQGGIVGTVIDPIIIAKYAIDSLSSGVILAHNHPSGNIKPSQADIRVTKEIKQGLDLFNIRVLDHVILTKNRYYSLADNQDL